ncbi:hypothetical protein F383_30495 [Gossypium arboreum]|uniref:Uncharacterized protein n=1 Tax=Gossypium arboreum TaxID=29729 RepID=A0A0B0PGS1_GOSAR|nr:hypothetical protein F383_30495 [Gossypium arboreum]
MPISQTWSYT